MPSPFPGMDPFLEDPALFPDLHNGLIILLQEALQAVLPPHYYAATGTRIWMERTQRWIEPDVDVVRPSRRNKRTRVVPGLDDATAVATCKPVVIEVPQDEHRETFLNIYRQKGSKERLVTSLEILSPSNKAPGTKGRRLYRRKQREILRSKTHLVEIDLLRGGKHTSAVPYEEARTCAGPWDYHISVRLYHEWGRYNLYPILIQQNLPAVEVPLVPSDGSVCVDFQAILDRAYDLAAFGRRIRYKEDQPIPALSQEQAEWATRLLRTQGILPVRRGK